MKLGNLEFWILNDGGFRLDGGSMFGIIPKALWEKKIPADDGNRIQLEMNCLLVRAAGKLLLVDTGAGDKWDAKRREIYALGNGARLPEQLAKRGVGLEQIDYVVNTHLHFDHCGWNTRTINGQLAPTFPNAQYVVQRGELEHAKHASEKDRASYMTDNYVPIEAAGQWRLLEGDQEIVPGVEVIRVPGHNADMQCVRLSGGGRAAFLFADLVPTTAHLSYPWIMAYDLYPLTTLENKHKWIPKIARSGTIALFPHDSKVPAARLYERDGQFHAESIEVD